MLQSVYSSIIITSSSIYQIRGPPSPSSAISPAFLTIHFSSPSYALMPSQALSMHHRLTTQPCLGVCVCVYVCVCVCVCVVWNLPAQRSSLLWYWGLCIGRGAAAEAAAVVSLCAFSLCLSLYLPLYLLYLPLSFSLYCCSAPCTARTETPVHRQRLH